MQTTKPTQQYLDQANALSAEEVAKLAKKFALRSSDRRTFARLTQLEQVALQLQHDQETLEQWRSNIARLAEGGSPAAAT